MTGAVLLRYVLGAGGILFVAPVLLFCFWPDVLRAWFEAGPEGIDNAPSGARGLIADLKQLGFQAIGVKVEKTPLRAKVREFSFVAADRQCYASIGGSRTPYRLYYYTPFPAGGLALTSSAAFPKIRSEKVAQHSYPKAGAQALLDHHHQALSSFGQRGEVVATTDARIEATYVYYRTPEVRRVMRRTGLILLAWFAFLGWLLVR